MSLLSIRLSYGSVALTHREGEVGVSDAVRDMWHELQELLLLPFMDAGLILGIL